MENQTDYENLEVNCTLPLWQWQKIVIALANDGHLVLAVKVYRRTFGAESLRQALDIVKELQENDRKG